MKRLSIHLIGVASSGIAMLASLALVTGYEHAWPDGSSLDGAVALETVHQELRQFEPGRRHWTACAAPQASVRPEAFGGGGRGHNYECNDGSTLWCVRSECMSADVAQREIEARLWGIDGVAPRWRARTIESYASGYVVEFTKAQPADIIDGGARYNWGFAFVDGTDVAVIYGPSRDHVVSLYEANPDRGWKFPRQAPN